MRTHNKISHELLDYVADADAHTKLSDVAYSTDLREIVKVGHMIDRHKEKAPAAGTASA
ncbi:hypothetical protein [Salibacterium qingdaonense]|uniref:Uncharacterized protein n=1 Tax=Salibacterium qingdaonense TaxID=266892 RepID=A0A1I4QX44_9BACI|nr:hypothetical protein [Salibacterium qingdaonense]SFM44266.1 hypothetical protein SAMN04488054_15115 [Salibacterium qingdaonense]